MFEVKTIADALYRLGMLDNRKLTLIVWTNVTKDCKPMARPVGLFLPQGLSTEISQDIIMGINSKAWILAIIDEHKNVYKITEAEKFATKGCKEDGGTKPKKESQESKET